LHVALLALFFSFSSKSRLASIPHGGIHDRNTRRGSVPPGPRQHVFVEYVLQRSPARLLEQGSEPPPQWRAVCFGMTACACWSSRLTAHGPPRVNKYFKNKHKRRLTALWRHDVMQHLLGQDGLHMHGIDVNVHFFNIYYIRMTLCTVHWGLLYADNFISLPKSCVSVTVIIWVLPNEE